MTPDQFAQLVIEQVTQYASNHPGIIDWHANKNKVWGYILQAARGPKGQEQRYSNAKASMPDGRQQRSSWSWDFVIGLALIEMITLPATDQLPSQAQLPVPDSMLRARFLSSLRILGLLNHPSTSIRFGSGQPPDGTFLQQVLLCMMMVAAPQPA